MEPAADLRERNLGAAFGVLDYDGDGVVTAGDFTQLAESVCEQLSLPDGGPWRYSDPRRVPVMVGADERHLRPGR